MGINKVILVGHVGKDPSVNYVKQDLPVAKFSFATTETFKKDNEKHTVTEWHQVEVWRSLAKVVEQYVKKGSHLYIEGKLKTDSYDKNGVTVYSTKIVCSSFEMLGSKGTTKASTQPTQQAQTNQQQTGYENDIEAGQFEETDDLPF